MPSGNRQVLLLAALVGFASLLLHGYATLFPRIQYDDFQILVQSLSWPAAWANLWVPANEHAMPLGRLSTWVLLELAGRQTLYPAVLSLQGPLALLAALALVYRFVERELGQPFHGLLAMILFGITSVYHQAIAWYAASFQVLSLDMMLLALLAAQSWVRTGRWRWLVLCAFWNALAPAWFAIGVLGGPLCCLYLWPSGDEDAPPVRGRLRLLAAALPSLGTVAFLLVSLPKTYEQILHTAHYGSRTAASSFDPLVGLLYTCRSLVDNLLLGVFGISGVACPVILVPVVLLLLVAAMAWWCWRTPAPRFVSLGTGLILLSYLLVYSARAHWYYDRVMYYTNWGRYHLLPQLGLALLVCSGLQGREKQWLVSDRGNGMTRRQVRFAAGLIAVLFLVQLPRGVIGNVCYDPDQQVVLRRIEEVDAFCHAQRLSAQAARDVLGLLAVPGCNEDDNGWDLLRGSTDSRPRSLAERRRLLSSWITTAPGRGTGSP